MTQEEVNGQEAIPWPSPATPRDPPWGDWKRLSQTTQREEKQVQRFFSFFLFIKNTFIHLKSRVIEDLLSPGSLPRRPQWLGPGQADAVSLELHPVSRVVAGAPVLGRPPPRPQNIRELDRR